MAQPQRHARLDVHGHPLPELADVREEVLFATEANEARRRLLHTLVDQVCREHLRRGHNVEVFIQFIVADGRLQDQIYETTKRRWGSQVDGWRQAGEGR